MHRPVMSLAKAPLSGAFFFLLALWLAPVAADSCGPPPAADRVKVRYAHDGDTLTLHDGTRVRIIGLNTPELAAGDQPAQPLAIRARDHLRQLLFRHHNEVRYLPGEQPRGPHGRTLAYVWLPDGTPLSGALLHAGLGWLVAIPPDIRFVECDKKAEAAARAAQRGVWRGETGKARESATLDLHTSGFQLVRGRVTRVNQSQGATWINLQGRFAIRIANENLARFDPPPGQDWVGRILEARGWIRQNRGELRMNLGHPANLHLY